VKSVEVNQAQHAAGAFVSESPGDVQPISAELPTSRTPAPPTDGNSKRRRRSGKGSRKSPRRAEWRNGLFNLSFDDDCGYLALLFPPVVDTTPPTAASDGVGSSSDDGGPSAVKKDDGRRTSEPATERSWLASGGAATYDGRSTELLADISRVGSGVPGPTRDTRPLISDDDQVGSGGQESALRIVGEVLLPFLLAGLGSVFAGLVLNIVQVRIHFSLY